MAVDNAPSFNPLAVLHELSEDAVESLQATRLAFTVASRRSGTSSLAVLPAVPGVVGRHEPPPNFIEVMRHVQLGHEPDLARRWWTERKLPHIASFVESTYVETSNVFAKGFLEPLLKLGHTPDLLLPIRPPRDIARSMFALGTIPSRILNSDL